MITAYNTVYRDKYTNLFQEAMDVLIEKGKIDIIEQPVLDAEGNPVFDAEGNPVIDKVPANEFDYITSLEEYFTHMGDLTEIYNDAISSAQDNEDYAKYSKFLMLPLDEEYFEINANARTITVPNNFRRYGVSVTEDIIAETLLFRIDRYFDFVDLMTKKIWIQWKNPSGQEGASRVTLIDHESEPGKIIFGWPLTDKVVGKTKGKIEFAITFFTKEGTTIKYSFNTLPVEVDIKQGLELEMPISEEDVEQPYFDFIVNSNSAFSPEPSIPEFVEGVLGEEVNYGPEGKAVLRAQATITDTGSLNYKWFYYPSYIEENQAVDSKESINVSSYAKDVYVKTEDTARQDKKVYYIEKFEINSENPGYKVLEGEFPEDESVIVYERFSELTIPLSLGDGIEDTTHITEGTGVYYVEASNRYGTNTKTSRGPECEVPLPRKIEFTTQLPKAEFLVEDKVTLEVEAKEVNQNSSDSITYSWEYTSPEGEVEVPISTSRFLEAEKIGWYEAKATSTINGQSLYDLSERCKLVAPIRAPQIELPEDADMFKGDWYLDRSGELKAVIFIENLKQDFETEGIEVRWYKAVLDATEETDDDDIWLNKPEQDLKEIAPEVQGMGLELNELSNKWEAYLQLANIPADDKVYIYYVKVINTLNNEQAVGELKNEDGSRISIIVSQ